MEAWLPLVLEGYEGRYEVSNMGNVKSLLNNKLLLLQNQNGYKSVNLANGFNKRYYVHRLIAQTFIPNPNNKPYIDHINKDKTDNRVENLRWATNSENIANREYLGVSMNQGKWDARVVKDGITYRLRFEDKEEAIAWRKAKHIELFGEYSGYSQ